jgi:transposase
MPHEGFTRWLLLPELEWKKDKTGHAPSGDRNVIPCVKRSELEVCPKCATPSQSIYDQRHIRVKDAPIRGKIIWLEIQKRRFWCRTCKKPFTEPVPGIAPRRRTTERYRAEIQWAAERFSDLKSVRVAYQCSNRFLYQVFNERLDLEIRKRQDPWPTTIGIDEHSFQKRRTGPLPFVSLIADYNRKRVLELVPGKSQAEMEYALGHIPERDNVRQVIIDLTDGYRNFVQSFFPRALLIADKFHVLRLLHGPINRYRKEITGDRRSLVIRRLLLASGYRLDHFTKFAVLKWLDNHPDLKEIYSWKERLHGFYRIKGYNRAKRALDAMLDAMASSLVPEIQTLRRTLRRWRYEILNYFRCNGLTNARTEGFNNKAKVIKRRAYGYRNFENYRRRVLCACY